MWTKHIADSNCRFLTANCIQWINRDAIHSLVRRIYSNCTVRRWSRRKNGTSHILSTAIEIDHWFAKFYVISKNLNVQNVTKQPCSYQFSRLLVVMCSFICTLRTKILLPHAHSHRFVQDDAKIWQDCSRWLHRSCVKLDHPRHLRLPNRISSAMTLNHDLNCATRAICDFPIECRSQWRWATTFFAKSATATRVVRKDIKIRSYCNMHRVLEDD